MLLRRWAYTAALFLLAALVSCFAPTARVNAADDFDNLYAEIEAANRDRAAASH